MSLDPSVARLQATARALLSDTCPFGLLALRGSLPGDPNHRFKQNAYPEIAQSITHSLEYGGAIQTLSRSCIEQYDETGNHHAEFIKKISIAHIAR
ncbi:hypothetical protein [Paraburkholderia phytofirmans]|uniref:hypothetical protein n=1 Tax=Paraburkholderia TaxID=1822464 RepID=UPI0011DF31A1|nr:hypothetical protein [Paraburkholderia phytofirmans]